MTDPLEPRDPSSICHRVESCISWLAMTLAQCSAKSECFHSASRTMVSLWMLIKGSVCPQPQLLQGAEQGAAGKGQHSA